MAMLVLLIVPALMGWLIVDGIRSGVVRMRGGSYSREEEPRWFWAMIAVYAAVIAAFFALIGPIYVELITGS